MTKKFYIEQDEIEEYTLLLEKVLALRSLRIISDESRYCIDDRKLRKDTVVATEKISLWWSQIEKKYDLPVDGSERTIDFQNNLIIVEKER